MTIRPFRGLRRLTVPLLEFDEGRLVKTTHFDDEMRQLADRHYSRRTVGAKQFLYSGRKLVLRDAAGTILFGWLYPDPAMRMDAQTGATCAIFRNESTRRSSEIILEAEEHARRRWPEVTRFYTYVDPSKIESVNPGYCFKVAGWKYDGVSASGQHRLVKSLV
jgi:hypothetical protein